MTKFPWKAEYETGDEHIDTQHKQLLHLANLLVETSVMPDSEVARREAFKALFRYVEKHFEEEEAFWDNIDSPFASGQREDHRKLAAELDDLWANDKLAFVETTGEELVQWVESRLIDHMTGFDQKAVKASKE